MLIRIELRRGHMHILNLLLLLLLFLYFFILRSLAVCVPLSVLSFSLPLSLSFVQRVLYFSCFFFRFRSLFLCGSRREWSLTPYTLYLYLSFYNSHTHRHSQSLTHKNSRIWSQIGSKHNKKNFNLKVFFCCCRSILFFFFDRSPIYSYTKRFNVMRRRRRSVGRHRNVMCRMLFSNE